TLASGAASSQRTEPIVWGRQRCTRACASSSKTRHDCALRQPAWTRSRKPSSWPMVATHETRPKRTRAREELRTARSYRARPRAEADGLEKSTPPDAKVIDDN